MTIIAGQPLDLQTIITAINELNDLKAQLGLDRNESVVISDDRIKRTYPTSALSLEAVNVTLDKVETSANQVTFKHAFTTQYQNKPVVTATLFSTSGTNVVQDHSVVITTLNTKEVSGYVRFQANGSIANTSVNIIAVGSRIAV